MSRSQKAQVLSFRQEENPIDCSNEIKLGSIHLDSIGNDPQPVPLDQSNATFFRSK